MLRLTAKHASSMVRITSSTGARCTLIRTRDFSSEIPTSQGTLISQASPVALSPTNFSTEDTFEKIPVPPIDGSPLTDATDAALSVSDLGYYPSDLVMQGIELIHQSSGLPYWATIAAITVTARATLLPLAFTAMRNSARMANCKPELDIIKERMEADPTRKELYAKQMKALFEKHDCNPFKSIVFPLAQMPLFISFFFALKSMGDYYPDITTGGTLWFTDLSVPDPYMAMPIMAAGSFLMMIELGSDGMPVNENAGIMKNAMRVMALAMVPFTMNMPAAVFCYWTTANTFSIGQTLMLKVPGVREALDVPLPKPPPATASSSSLPKDVTFSNSPLKAILAKAKGEAMTKIPISESRQRKDDDGVAAGSFAYDEKKHVKLKVHSENPMKKSKKNQTSKNSNKKK